MLLGNRRDLQFVAPKGAHCGQLSPARTTVKTPRAPLASVASKAQLQRAGWMAWHRRSCCDKGNACLAAAMTTAGTLNQI